MATKSIIKNVIIKDKRLARTFVEALDKAEIVKEKKISRNCIEITGDKIKSFFD